MHQIYGKIGSNSLSFRSLIKGFCMPTYDYKCIVCGHLFELFQPMSAEPIKECPECGGLVKRLIGTGAGAIFKGNGFYQTDYKGSKSVKKESDKKDSTANKKDIKTTKPDAA